MDHLTSRKEMYDLKNSRHYKLGYAIAIVDGILEFSETYTKKDIVNKLESLSKELDKTYE